MSTVAPREVPLGGLRAMTVRRTLPNRERTTIGAWCFIDHYGPNRIKQAPHGTTEGSSKYVRSMLDAELAVGKPDADAPPAKAPTQKPHAAFGDMGVALAATKSHQAETDDTVMDGMYVAPHPHTGLQTVTWLLSGEVEHRDSVGSKQLIEPGQVNLMTAGRGIQHSEVSTVDDGWLHGVQLWVVLPDEHRNMAPFFEHHECPRVNIDGAPTTVFVGELAGVTAPTTTFTELLGAELLIPENTTVRIPYRADFEYGVLIDRGHASVNGEDVQPHHLAYVAPGAGELVIQSQEYTRVLLLGGVPFDESIVMWWNFIARTHEEIEEMREAWQNEVIAGGDPNGRFGTVDFSGEAIPAPEMPTVKLKSRASRR